MTSQQHQERLDAFFEGDDPDHLTKFERFQRRVQRAALTLGMIPRAPTWPHLGERLALLAWEGVVRLRRLLLWLAPFVATVYIVLDLIKD
ncbi:MAG: hypothetical protein F4117_14150 [Acidimicrobiales bacterium]|nr:hypothetical protein [Acidimicrobiales bacterium]MXX44240.1 hypothetical protein [Acidimicrobiales bacterium]MXZ14286.1 hypothetical protein [Acidimicrobiales bacterium]MYB82815.1 hypothetical protein [Acidimicrobiales bacterium]MYD34332.1 hypothetical protein [Acidimicrobiales bacterium]